MGSTSMRKSVSLPLPQEWLERGQEPVTATRIGSMIYTSGVPGIDRKTGQLAAGPERQFAAAFDNLTALLELAGGGAGFCWAGPGLGSRPPPTAFNKKDLAVPLSPNRPPAPQDTTG